MELVTALISDIKTPTVVHETIFLQAIIPSLHVILYQGTYATTEQMFVAGAIANERTIQRWPSTSAWNPLSDCSTTGGIITVDASPNTSRALATLTSKFTSGPGAAMGINQGYVMLT